MRSANVLELVARKRRIFQGPVLTLVFMFTRCPKCGHSPLPADQSLPAACGHCGVILAKVGQAPVRRTAGAPAASALARSRDDAGEDRPPWHSMLTYVPERVDSLAFGLRAALLLAFAIWSWVLIRLDVPSGEMGGSFIHRPLLIFHEAGHVIFRVLGEWMGVLGGTLGQLLMPLVLAGALLVKNRDTFGGAMGLWLFGVSILDVAPYMYDALDPQLTLLGGGSGQDSFHDWIYLFESVNAVARSQAIGRTTHALGALVVLVALAWAAWVLRQQYARIAGHVLHEE
jgi:ribosomal protein S27AE